MKNFKLFIIPERGKLADEGRRVKQKGFIVEEKLRKYDIRHENEKETFNI
jgi:hypothetical protein